ncbi:MAG TPA: hypothetical protein VMU77_03790 [Acidimicrobiales bacterium]|nr:hypothetical protein [Acidimicrobiales bacterium]
MKFRLADVDSLLEPGYVEDLRAIPMAQLRERRAECQRIEVALSYLRRMVHGRLDVVYYDLTRRSEGRGSSEFANIVENMDGILAGRIHAHYSGRLTSILAPDFEEVALEELDTIAGIDSLQVLPDLTDDEVRVIADRLTDLEEKLSDRRRHLHDVLDKLHQEIVRRYKTGEANVDSLLQ